jgi:hypothetical protein
MQIGSNGTYAIIQGAQSLVTSTITSDGTVFITGTLEIISNDGQLSLAKYSPATIEVVGSIDYNIPASWSCEVTANNLYQAGTLYVCDLNYAAETVYLYLNGILLLTGVLAAGSVDYVDVGSISDSVTAYSEVIVQDSSTLGYALLTVPPLANGNTNTWTGSVGNIDEITINDANYNTTTADSQLAEYTVTYTLPSGDWNVVAYVEEARVSVGSTGPQHFEFAVRTYGSDYVAGTVTPTNYLDNYSYIWAQNPHTALPWGTLDFGAGFNLGIESLA